MESEHKGEHRPAADKTNALKANLDAQNDKVSRRIRAIRSEKGISQADMAKLLDLDRSSYHRMEKRGEKLTVEQLERIAALLEVPLVSLVSGQLPTEIESDRIELSQLQNRVKELEDRLHDKQQIIESLEEGPRYARKTIYDILYQTALSLNLIAGDELTIKHKDDDYLNWFTDENWGVERMNDQKESILVFGPMRVFLTAADLLKIFAHLESSNIELFRLLNSLEHIARFPHQSLIRRTLYASLLNRLPQERRDRLFKEGGYPPYITDLLK